MQKYIFKPYNKNYPTLFKQEKERIESNAKDPLMIEHIGSTSIPDLGGKGIIDIAIAVQKDKMTSVRHELEAIGYEFRPNFSTMDRFYFVMEGRYHIHLTFPENPEWKAFLSVRDFLLTHPKEREEYAELKRKAAEEANQDGKAYRRMKEPFFQKIKSNLG